LVELVVVLILVGILAVVALPKFIGRQEYATRGFYDAAQASVRYAQKAAIAQRRNVHVMLGAGTLRLCYDAGCASALVDPTANSAFLLSAPAGVSLAGASLFFDGLGRPSTGATFTVTDSAGARTFTVEAQTGYVHP
jgi:MSHA pilin protein MshC